MNNRIFLFFLILFFQFGFSQTKESPPTIVETVVDSLSYDGKGFLPTDSLIIANPTTDNIIFPKNFDDQFHNKYKGEEFDYTTIKPQESLWTKIEKIIKKLLRSIFGELDASKASDYSQIIMRIFAVIIIGFVLYFLVKFLLGKDGNFFFSKRNKKLNIQSQDLQENIHEINFVETISAAERNRDYRSAVRYQFLMVLKKLTDKKMINWNPEKTNKDYLSELKTPELKASFNELVYIFDYVWYGEFDINEENYNHFKQKFLNFKA